MSEARPNRLSAQRDGFLRANGRAGLVRRCIDDDRMLGDALDSVKRLSRARMQTPRMTRLLIATLLLPRASADTSAAPSGLQSNS